MVRGLVWLPRYRCTNFWHVIIYTHHCLLWISIYRYMINKQHMLYGYISIWYNNTLYNTLYMHYLYVYLITVHSWLSVIFMSRHEHITGCSRITHVYNIMSWIVKEVIQYKTVTVLIQLGKTWPKREPYPLYVVQNRGTFKIKFEESAINPILDLNMLVSLDLVYEPDWLVTSQ